MQATISQEAAEKAAAGGIEQGEKLTKSALEDGTKQSSLGSGTPEERFVWFTFYSRFWLTYGKAFGNDRKAKRIPSVSGRVIYRKFVSLNCLHMLVLRLINISRLHQLRRKRSFNYVTNIAMTMNHFFCFFLTESSLVEI